MAEVSRDALLAALRQISDPRDGRDVVTSGLLDGLETKNGLVQAALAVPRAAAAQLEPVRQAVEAALKAVPGVRSATAILTAHKPATTSPPSPRNPHAAAAEARAARPKLLAETKAVIAVASGKGGVGKSTTAVNLAVALGRRGLSVGLLDADIYGPSLPRMLGEARRPEVAEGRMVPLEAWGVKAMSIGFLIEERQAMIWRGPMVMGALEQLMDEVAWGPLDVMVVDMPPGTGDAQLTMAQRVSLAGAVIVSTPQDIALTDARRGVAMFEKTQVPVLGLVENMSFFCCPNCGHRTDLFGHGGARAEAETLGVPFLGEIPLLRDIRATGDAGTPIAASAPDSEAGRAYAALAARVADALSPRLG